MASYPNKETIQMPALCRPFDLGIFYNARTEEIIPIYNLCSTPDSKNITTRNDRISFSLIGSDNLSDKFESLNVSSSLQISILAGMIEPEGSGSFLKKKKGQIRESSIHVRCHCLTAVKGIQLNLPNTAKPVLVFNSQEIINSGATHVVTQIQYGAEATFTFSQQLKETDDEQKVSAKLAASGKNLLRALEGKVEINGDVKPSEKHNETDISCHFEGNFQLPQQLSAPTTYEEAVKFASGFTNVLSDSIAKDSADGNKPLGVPCFVGLYPLVLVPGFEGAKVLHSEIKLPKFCEYKRILEDYETMENKLVYMISDSLTNKIQPFKKKLHDFQQNCNLFHGDFKTKFRDLVISIRNGQEDDSSFKKLMVRISDPQFSLNPNRLKNWLSEKHLEICMTKRFQDLVKEKVKSQEKILFFPTPENLQETMTDSKVCFGFEIAFSAIKRPEPFLALMEKQVIDMDVNDDQTIETKTKDMPWYQDERIEKEMSIFVDLINGNFEDEIVFALTAPDNEDEDDLRTSGLSFAVYYRGIKHYGGSALLMVLCKHYQKPNLLEIVQLLFDRNIDVNSVDKEGLNALLNLCQYYKEDNLIDIIQFLLEQKININYQDKDGWNALSYVCRFYSKENLDEIVELLLEEKINTNSQDDEGWNALLLLCQNYQNKNLMDIIRLILSHQIKINCQDNDRWNATCKLDDGRNALHLVCRHYNRENLIDIVKFFIVDQKIDVDCKTDGGWNALHLVCRYYKKNDLIAIVRLLLKEIDIKKHSQDSHNTSTQSQSDNSHENNDWNALHFVCRYQPPQNLMDLVRLLIIEHNIIDKNVQTTGDKIGSAHSFLVDRSATENVKDVIKFLESKA